MRSQQFQAEASGGVEAGLGRAELGQRSGARTSSGGAD